jgi:probable HAF family extracellular repeat protein
LGTLGGTISYGIALNSGGQVAGFSTTVGAGVYHAFLYTGTPGAGGQMVDLNTWLAASDAADAVHWTLTEATGVAPKAQVCEFADLWHPADPFKPAHSRCVAVKPRCPFLQRAKIGAIMGNDGQWATERRIAFFYANVHLKKTYENSFRITSHIVLQSKLWAI